MTIAAIIKHVKFTFGTDKVFVTGSTVYGPLAKMEPETVEEHDVDICVLMPDGEEVRVENILKALGASFPEHFGVYEECVSAYISRDGVSINLILLPPKYYQAWIVATGLLWSHWATNHNIWMDKEARVAAFRAAKEAFNAGRYGS